MCSTDVYCSKQTGSSSTSETITHHFFVSGIGQKKTVDAAKICGGAENVVKTETQQTFVNGLLGFITLGIYTAGAYCFTILYELPIDMGNSHLHCSLIYFWPFQLFLHSDQPPSDVQIIPFSGARQSGGGCIIHAGGGRLHALTDRLL